MPRASRIVVPGIPHHITQRGNRQMPIFFSDDDRRYYIATLTKACAAHDVKCFAWCLMDNHVHLILQPSTAMPFARRWPVPTRNTRSMSICGKG